MELKRFKKTKDKSIEDMDNMETHIGVSAMYTDLVRQYSGKTIYFLPVDVESEKYKTKVKMVRKLIKICNDLGVSFDVYMEVQFEKLVPWLKREKNLTHPPFNMLVSNGAVTRFNQWQEVHHKKYESKREAQKATVPVQPNIRRAILESAETLYNRLNYASQPHEQEEVVIVLEMLARIGQLTKMYIYSHPMVNADSPVYLAQIYEHMETILTKHEKETIKEMRKLVEEKYGVKHV